MEKLLLAAQKMQTENEAIFSQEEKTKLQIFIDNLTHIVYLISDILIKSKKFIINPVENITPTEESLQNFFVGVNKKISFDKRFWELFPKEELGFSTSFETVLYRFKKRVNHRDLLLEAEKFGVKKAYSYTEGLAIIRVLLLAGEIPESVTVCFASPQRDSLSNFHVYYYNHEFKLSFLTKEPPISWDINCGICSNDNS
ncbi:MAG: hypothetical protein WCQ32_02395 [bacterium]